MLRIATGLLLTALPAAALAQTAAPADTPGFDDRRNSLPEVRPSELPAEAPDAAPASAPQDSGPRPGQHRWLIQTSLYSRHFRPDPNHNNNQHLINVEYQRHDEWILGAATFSNSFSQPSQMAYFGKRWYPSSTWPGAHVKFVVGLLHGYKPPYDNKIPFNDSGVAPVILPAIGYSYKQFATEIILFGTAGMLWTLGFYLD